MDVVPVKARRDGEEGRKEDLTGSLSFFLSLPLFQSFILSLSLSLCLFLFFHVLFTEFSFLPWKWNVSEVGCTDRHVSSICVRSSPLSPLSLSLSFSSSLSLFHSLTRRLFSRWISIFNLTSFTHNLLSRLHWFSFLSSIFSPLSLSLSLFFLSLSLPYFFSVSISFHFSFYQGGVLLWTCPHFEVWGHALSSRSSLSFFLSSLSLSLPFLPYLCMHFSNFDSIFYFML